MLTKSLIAFTVLAKKVNDPNLIGKGQNSQKWKLKKQPSNPEKIDAFKYQIISQHPANPKNYIQQIKKKCVKKIILKIVS